MERIKMIGEGVLSGVINEGVITNDAFQVFNVHHQMSIFEIMTENTIKRRGRPNKPLQKPLQKLPPLTQEQKRRQAVFEEECRKYPEARANDTGYKKLAAAVVLGALKDAKGKDPDARREAMHWLESEAAELFFDALNIDKKGLEKWKNNGKPMTLHAATRKHGKRNTE
jgi:hypothetical protein